MPKLIWDERTRLAAAAAAAAAGLLSATLAVVRPTWLFPSPAHEPPIALPDPYATCTIFDGRLIDTDPTKGTLEESLNAFSEHIQKQAEDFGFTDRQCRDLGVAAEERLRGMLDPNLERDYALAAKRGLASPKSKMVARIEKHRRQVERLKLAPFGLKSAIVVPQNRQGAKYYKQFSAVDRISTVNYRLLPEPTYNTSGIDPGSERVEVLLPLRVPVLDLKKKQFTRSPSAVVVFSFLFVWAETDTRHQWVPEKYSQYNHDNYFPRPNEQDRFAVIGYPMAF